VQCRHFTHQLGDEMVKFMPVCNPIYQRQMAIQQPLPINAMQIGIVKVIAF